MTRKAPSLRISLIAVAVAAACAAPVAMAAGAAPLQTREAPASAPAAAAGARLIITYRNGSLSNALKLKTVNAAAARSRAMSSAAFRSGSKAPSASHMRKLAVGADLMRLDRRITARELDALVGELAADPAIAAVEVDQMMRHTGAARVRGDMVTPQLTPNDQYYGQYQWHLQNTVGGIHAPAAWDVSTGAGVVVAVLDTGIVEHPDMDANMLAGYDFISDALVSRRPTNERVPGAHDYGDWNDDDDACDVSTSSFHGTHVAGTIAELSNNSSGMAGVAHNAKVLPVRVLGRCGGYTSDIADAIIWAAGGNVPGVPTNANPAEIINMSLGGTGSCKSVSQAAINTAVSLGTTVVVAAGNSNGDVADFSPASCDNVISVGAARITGGRASYSNYGAAVDLAGPGGGGGVDGNPNGYVWQANNSSDTSPEEGGPSYGGMAGTSMAAPHVAGVAALVQSAVVGNGGDPKTPAELEAILVGSARAFPATPDRPIGSGLLDAPAALAKALEVPCNPAVEDCTPPATVLTNKVVVANVAGAAGSQALYSIEVPAGAKHLNVMTYGGTGNVGMYVSAGTVPSAQSHHYKSVRPGNTETVRANKPAATTYFILLVGDGSFSGVSLQARID